MKQIGITAGYKKPKKNPLLKKLNYMSFFLRCVYDSASRKLPLLPSLWQPSVV
jgi:hypothetical protein